MLGALLAATGYLKLDSLLQAISEKFEPVIAEKNHAAARASFEAAQTIHADSSANLEVAR
jgi:Pyruvate/2-oxoacid:ferredoxin oxidoreductase gamma subunit